MELYFFETINVEDKLNGALNSLNMLDYALLGLIDLHALDDEVAMALCSEINRMRIDIRSMTDNIEYRGPSVSRKGQPIEVDATILN